MDNFFYVLRVFLEETLERDEPMAQTFRVVQTVDPQNDFLLGISHETWSLFGHELKPWKCLRVKHTLMRYEIAGAPFKRNPDGKCGNFHNARPVLHEQIFVIDPAAEASVAAIEEIDAVIFDVEADHVASCHPACYSRTAKASRSITYREGRAKPRRPRATGEKCPTAGRECEGRILVDC